MSKLLGYENEIKNKNILSIQMNLLNKCTSKCKSCRKYTWPDNELAFNDIKTVLTYLKNNGLQTVVFSGGDPILYKDFDKVIDLCNELEIKFSLITTLITRDVELLEKIALNAYRIHVSLDSVFDERYKRIRGVDACKIVKANVKYVQSFRENKIPVRISSTMGKMNYIDAISLYNFAKENGCLINYYFLHTWDDLKMSEKEVAEFYHSMKIIAMDEKERKKVISNAKSIMLQEFEFETVSQHCKQCYLPYINATIDSNGDVYPCCRLLDDNGCYGEQVENVYGNIVGKSEIELDELFKNRFKKYPLNHRLCNECGDRYNGVLAQLEKIIDDKKEPLFL